VLVVLVHRQQDGAPRQLERDPAEHLQVDHRLVDHHGRPAGLRRQRRHQRSLGRVAEHVAQRGQRQPALLAGEELFERVAVSQDPASQQQLA
jgi:hypothetical protein